MVNPSTGSYTSLALGIQNYGNSQLETAYNALGNNEIYVTDGSNFGKISNPNGITPSFSSGVLSGYNPMQDLNNGVYQLPDQVDGYDYSSQFVAMEPECCVAVSSFDVEEAKNNEEQTGTQTWSAGLGNNPFVSSSIVTVKDKLVIKSGANITINNMTFRFAPFAELIVENGARLTINGTTLTVDTTCSDAPMWKGVAVWGTGTGTFQAAVSGRFVAQNNSVIEHALEAASNYNYLATPSNANNGGIIKATTGTTFRNNLKDLVFKPYQSMVIGNPQNDQSFFSDVTFITDGSLNIPSYNNYIEHVDLDNVTGIRFLGCDFENTDVTATTYTYLNRGVGITATDAKFTVDGRCTSMVFPCGSYDRSKFTNLTRGISASNSTLRPQIASVKRSDFDNVWRSIYLNNMEPPIVILNNFDVGASFFIPFLGLQQSYGLYLNNCSGYTVENNDFTTTHNGYFGVYVNSSGTAANEIYRNNFSNFVVASQAANVNGDGGSTTAQNGLEFRCNKYVNTSDYDILVSSGRVRSDQGNCLSGDPKSPANNQFSYTAQYGDYWLNNSPTVSITSTYHYSQNGSSSNLPPRAITTGFFIRLY